MKKSLLLIVVIIFLSSCSFKLAKPKYDYKEVEVEIFTGCIPNSKEPLSFPIDVVVNQEELGKVEAGKNNLRLYFVSSKNDRVEIWQYTDYSCVNRISIDTQNMALKIYYDRTLVRDERFVNILNLETLKLKEVLLKRGRFRI